MNRASKRWHRRHRGRRGVSPIIATILLVAITVIIAAVLYTLLIPFLSHSTTPLQSNFAFGQAVSRTGTGAAGCPTGDSCWQLSIQTANGGVAPSSMSLFVQNATGQTSSTSSWNFTFVTAATGVVAWAHGPQAGVSQGWTAGPGHTVDDTLTLVTYLWIDTGSAAPLPSGDILYATGQNSWSGQVPADLPS